MQTGFHTDTGLRQDNQDNGLADPALALFAVADGVGGGSAGEQASACALLALRQAVQEGLSLADAVRSAHLAVEMLQDALGVEDAATTLVAARVTEDHLDYAWVGDSRLYVLSDRHLVQLTEDHTVARLLGEGAAVSRHMLTQALGAAPGDGLQVDTGRFPLCGGERLLLCSDGLHGALPRDKLFAELVQPRDAQRTAEKLVTTALAAGADDNVTVLVVDVEAADMPATDANMDHTPPNHDQNPPDSPAQYVVFGILLAVLAFILIFFGY